MNANSSDAFGSMLVMMSVPLAFLAISYWVRSRAQRKYDSAALILPCEYRPSWAAYAISLSQFLIGSLAFIVYRRTPKLDELFVLGLSLYAVFFFVLGGHGIITLRKTRVIVSEDNILFEEAGRKVIIPVEQLKAVYLQRGEFVLQCTNTPQLLIPIVFENSSKLYAQLQRAIETKMNTCTRQVL